MVPMRAAVCVTAPDARAVPAEGVAATLWTQVLDWLGYRADEIAWVEDPSASAIRLPPLSSWHTPGGKRELWLALKACVRER